MREFLRQNRVFVAAVTLAAFVPRLIFLCQFPYIAGDSFTYGDLAKNWMQHGVFGFSGPNGPVPTYIRLPGYPGFLALVWSVFGIEHYTAVMAVQMFLDVGTCFLVAELTRELVSERAARMAFLIAALCPFTANFAATPLAETPEIFFSALALLCAAKGLRAHAPHPLRWWTGCGAALAACILLRPDGGILLMAIGGLLLFGWIRGRNGEGFFWRAWSSPRSRSRRWSRGRRATGGSSTSSSPWRPATPTLPASSSPWASSAGSAPGWWTTSPRKRCIGPTPRWT